MPKISVIVPVYNVEPYLERCVKSILAQTFSDFELILIDDGSPDNCPAICDDYAHKDNRVHVIHQENGGLSAARNAGLDWAFANSESEWITFIDSDDWVDLNYLYYLYNACIEFKTKISICLFDERKAEEDSFSLSDDVDVVEYDIQSLYSIANRKINVISSCGKLYFKKMWQEIRFPLGRINEDRFTTHKALFQTDIIAVISGAPLYHYRLTQNSIMRSAWSPKRFDDLLAIKEQFAYFKENDLSYAYKRTADSLLWLIQEAIKDLDNSAPQYYKCRTIYVKKLRRAIRKYRKLLGLSKRTYPEMYELAFPRKMKRYWKRQAIKKIMKESGLKGLIKKCFNKMGVLKDYMETTEKPD